MCLHLIELNNWSIVGSEQRVLRVPVLSVLPRPSLLLLGSHLDKHTPLSKSSPYFIALQTEKNEGQQLRRAELYTTSG